MTTLHMKNSRDYLALRVEELRVEIQRRDTDALASNTGAVYSDKGTGQGEFLLPMWGRDLILTWPEFTGRDAQTGDPLPTMTMAMLSYYFHTSDGTPPAGTWIAFTELPDGKFYTAAFQGYTGNELTKAFGNDLDSFQAAAQLLGGRQETLGDAAFAFQALPRVHLLAVGWQGDEDFQPSYRVLFDGNSSHHLSTDACAILGSTLSSSLIAQRQLLA
ncbi:MAG: DUF3786 domain-containing protein [Anaerolineaceae bacterium]|nr:MAG: DUF3786 domain-containing protein [Anaerolineaceae bacterium]